MLLNHPRALRTMDEHQVDAVVASTPRNSYYASDFRAAVTEFGHQETLFAAVVPRSEDEKPTLIMPEALMGGLLDHPTWMPAIRPIEYLNTAVMARQPEPVRLEPLQSDIEAIYQERVVADLADNMIAALAECLTAMGLASGRVAFDDLRVGHHVGSLLPDLTVVDGHDLFIAIRAVKTPEEHELLRRGAEMNQAAVQHVLPMIQAGTEWVGVAEAYRAFIHDQGGVVTNPSKALQYGAEYQGEWYPDVLMRNNDWKVHDRKPIIFEAWGAYEGYAFDFSRTVHVGEPTTEYLDMCTSILEAWRAGIEAQLRPGISTKELFQASSRLVEAAGIPTPKKTVPFFHCIGLDIIEIPAPYPVFGNTKSFVLEPDMVLNCELLYYGHTLAPYHIESTFRITEDGAEAWHTMPEDLTIL